MKRNTAAKKQLHKTADNQPRSVTAVATLSYPYQPQPNTSVTTTGGNDAPAPQPRNFFGSKGS